MDQRVDIATSRDGYPYRTTMRPSEHTALANAARLRKVCGRGKHKGPLGREHAQRAVAEAKANLRTDSY